MAEHSPVFTELVLAVADGVGGAVGDGAHDGLVVLAEAQLARGQAGHAVVAQAGHPLRLAVKKREVKKLIKNKKS